MPQQRSFTLMELVVVIVIVGILAALGMINFGGQKERTLNKEAQANLRLIIAAERIYRMEFGEYSAAGSNAAINSTFRLVLPTSNPNWNYSTTGDATASCAQATRNGGDSRTFSMRNTDENPVSGSCP